MKIILASHNKKKLAELQIILSRAVGDIEVLPPSAVGYEGEPDENGSTFEENALIKARAIAALGYNAVADDSGLCVDALNGEPGIFSARWSGGGDGENNAKLLRELSTVTDDKRGAKFVCAAVFVSPDGTELISRGECHGVILHEPRGENGFGYDPLFYYPELGKSFAELDGGEKNAVSHRGKAIAGLARKLAELFGS